MQKPETALVTGVTSGIGKAIAGIFAQNGVNLIITGRRKDRLDELADYLKNQYDVKVCPLAFDVRNYEAVKENVSRIPDEFKPVDVLINNAGLSLGLNPVHEGDVNDWDQMIDTNIKGLLYMTREITPGMVERKKGHVINIGSLAGKEVYELGNVYCATKHAVDALTKSMRIDLVRHGIKVTGVNPGLVETEFSLVRFKGNEERAKNVYEGYQPLKPEDVAEAVWFAVTQPKHVNINDLLVTPSAQGHSKMVIKDS